MHWQCTLPDLTSSFHVEYPFRLVAVLPMLRCSFSTVFLYFRQLVKKYIYWAKRGQLITELQKMMNNSCFFRLRPRFGSCCPQPMHHRVLDSLSNEQAVGKTGARGKNEWDSSGCGQTREGARKYLQVLILL
jgi:hypothetical protein